MTTPTGRRLDAAEASSQEMAQLLAAANGERDEGNIGKVTRDKAYTLPEARCGCDTGSW